MSVKLKLIVAASENMGIGKNGDLPWKLRKEMAHFSKLTSTTNNPDKKNVVIMGRLTWESIPQKFRPLPNRINFVLSRSNLDFTQHKNVYKFSSLNEAIESLSLDKFKDLYEDVWIIGGASVYKEALQSPYFYRMYLTKVQKEFDCDTFLPPFLENVKEVSDPEISQEKQEENGITYTYHVYERT